MTLIGSLHFAAALASLVLGLVVLLRPKGGRVHRRTGRAYVAAMLTVNLAAFLVYGDGQPGIFHLLALISLATLGAGLWLIRARRSIGRRASHGITMAWSFVGLTAAGVGQGVAALNLPVWPAIAVVLLAGGAAVHFSGIPARAARLR